MAGCYRDYPELGRIHFSPGGRQEVDFIYQEIVRDREYLRHGITLQPGDTVFDVGANVGVFALFAARECQYRARLFCFEPIPVTCESLELNLARLNDRPTCKTRLIRQGLTRLGGERSAEFSYFAAAPGNSTMFPAEKRAIFARLTDNRAELIARVARYNPWRLPWPSLTYRLLTPIVAYQLNKLRAAFRDPQVFRCPLTTIAAVCQKYDVSAIDLLKIDVEGSELDVLQGLDAAAWQLTRRLVLEAHDVDGRLAKITSLLQQQGLRNIASVRPAWAEAFDLNAFTLYARR